MIAGFAVAISIAIILVVYNTGKETGREEFITQCQKDGGFTIECESNNVKFYKKYTVTESNFGCEVKV